jgi:exopolysaccharide biosynthesis polyprenyl glycosylphosphotransferase
MSIKSFSTPFGLTSVLPEQATLDTSLTPTELVELRAKRLMDLTGAVVGLILLWPVMLLIALAIWFDSRGPILFRQKRMGLRGERFTFLKFRTMVRDAETQLVALEEKNEAQGGVLFKMKNDPRVTPLGRFLRRTSLDELPQLFNILKGEMSLVGPRPLQERDSIRLEALDAEAYARRLSVPPGLTGAWQVGGRSNTDSERMLALDLDYVDNWSLRLDIAILCRTIAVVLRGHGAY